MAAAPPPPDHLPAFPVQVQYFDGCTDAELLCSVLRWCDSAQGSFWAAQPDIPRQMLELWSGSSVMVSNTVELIAGCEALPPPSTGTGALAMLTPWLTRVGRTSWGLAFSIVVDGRPLANVATVMVSVSPEDLTRSAPLPAALLPLMEVVRARGVAAAAARGLRGPPSDLEDLARALPKPEEPEPADAYVWRSPVRVTDCDSFGHINNAKYALLAEEARAVATHACAYPPTAAPPPPRGCRGFYCTYTGQPQPFDELVVSTWQLPVAPAGAAAAAAAAAADGGVNGGHPGGEVTFAFRARVGQEVAATIVLRTVGGGLDPGTQSERARVGGSSSPAQRL